MVVWQDDFLGSWDIFAADISDSNAIADFAVVTDTADQQKPDIDENIIVWQDRRNGNWDIYGYNADFTDIPEGRICGDINNDGLVNGIDLSIMIDHLFITLEPLEGMDCWAANVDGHCGVYDITGGDLDLLIQHLFIDYTRPLNCASCQ